MYSRALRLYPLASKFNSYNKLYIYQRTLTLQIQEIKSNQEQRRYYRKFGHDPDKGHIFTKIWYSVIALGVLLPCLNYEA